MMLSWQLAWRFSRGKHQSAMAAFLSASSTLGIAVGCFALILILSVMNGFERELRQSLLAVLPHAELTAVEGHGLLHWHQLQQQMTNEADIKFVQPVVNANGLLRVAGQMQATQLVGVEARLFTLSPGFEHMQKQGWAEFEAQPDSVMLGTKLADALGVQVGQKVQLMLPTAQQNGQFAAPTVHWFSVAGVIKTGTQLDEGLVIGHLETAARLLDIESGASSLQLFFHDPFIAPMRIRQLGNDITQMLYMSDWTRTQGDLYQDILLVRQVVYVVLSLVIAVACFNIISSQIMTVSEKQGEIAMLKTMGAKNSTILATFVWQGLLNGITGILMGSGIAILVAKNLSAIASQVEQWFGIRFLSGDVYFIDFLPSHLQWFDVVATVSIALALSLLSTFYPAYKAARIAPAAALSAQ